MNVRRESGDVAEACDWCGQTVDRDSAHYEQMHDPVSDREIVLTGCSAEHLRWLREQYPKS